MFGRANNELENLLYYGKRILIILLFVFSLSTSNAFCDNKVGHLGIFDTSYDRTVWKYDRSTEGIDIFKHNFIKNCTVYSAIITQTFEEDVKKNEVVIGGKTYDVTKGFVSKKLNSLYYSRKSKSPVEVLRVSVWRVGDVSACIQAAEKLIIDYEKNNK